MVGQVFKVSILGSGVNGEVWSVNPVYSLSTEPDLTFDQLNTIATAINALTIPSNLKAAMPPAMAVTGVRVEQRTGAGVLQGQLEQNRGAPVPGTGTSFHPIQTAVVTSLITAHAGASGRGRLYWPAVGLAIDSTTLRFTSGIVSSVLTDMETYLSAIETAVQTTAGPTELCVWSRKTQGCFGVVRLRIGNVPDVQRRRRDALVETYASIDYTP